jgi:hypothetical protein
MGWIRITVLLLFAAASAPAQITGAGGPAQKPRKNSYLPPLGTNAAALLGPGAARKNHVLFVNVGGALPDGDFREAVAYVKAQWWVNVAAAGARRSAGEEMARDPRKAMESFGGRACFVVEVVRDGVSPDIVAVPGWFARVNVGGVGAGSPSADYLKKRRTQMLLKGLAYACGVGSNADEFCVMYFRSGPGSPAHMDSSSATFSPFAYVPLREALLARGGEEIFDYME